MPGEADAISLAKELNIVDLLIDERKGSKVALSEGLSPIPTVLILERAANLNLIDLKSAIANLRLTSMRVSTEVLDAVLARNENAKVRDGKAKIIMLLSILKQSTSFVP